MPCEDDIIINLETTEEDIVVNVTECAATVNIDEGFLAGRGSDSGYGPIEEITLGDNLELDGTVLNVTIDPSSFQQSYKRHFMFMGG